MGHQKPSSDSTMKTTVSLYVELEVEFNYFPGCRGQRDSCCGVAGAGPALEPDEPPMAEVLASCFNGTKVNLTEEQFLEIEPELLSAYTDAEEAAAEDRADAKREEMLIERQERERGMG